MLKPHCTTRRARHVSMTWWERAAARPRSPSITLQVREKYYGPHHAALCAHDTTVWQRGGHLRQAASRNLGMTATLTKRCQDPTLPPAEWQRRTKLTCRRLLRASNGVVNYVTSYTKHIILKKNIAGAVTLWAVKSAALYMDCPILLTPTVLDILFTCCNLLSTYSFN